jgi:hypothetical protein
MEVRMNIAAMNVRLTIQKNEVIKDKYGNHTNTWTDFYTCWATPVQSGGSEKQEAGTTTAPMRSTLPSGMQSASKGSTPQRFGSGWEMRSTTSPPLTRWDSRNGA